MTVSLHGWYRALGGFPWHIPSNRYHLCNLYDWDAGTTSRRPAHSHHPLYLRQVTTSHRGGAPFSPLLEVSASVSDTEYPIGPFAHVGERVRLKWMPLPGAPELLKLEYEWSAAPHLIRFLSSSWYYSFLNFRWRKEKKNFRCICPTLEY